MVAVVPLTLRLFRSAIDLDLFFVLLANNEERHKTVLNVLLIW